MRVKARGFVLPERADTPGRFVVCWDGLVYPAVTVGEPADLERDINDLAASMKGSREAEKSNRYPQGVSWGFPTEGRNYPGLAGVDDHSPIKLCLLLRLGRADLAETLFAAGTTWTPEPRARDLTDYGISYLTLAINWASSAFERLIRAHMRGEDVIALDAARRLARFRDLASAKADAMGFPASNRQNRTRHRARAPTSISSTSSTTCSAIRSEGPRCLLEGRSPGKAAIPRPGSRP